MCKRERERERRNVIGRQHPSSDQVSVVAHRVCVSEVGGLSMRAAGEIRSPVSCSSEPDDSMEPYTTERLSRLPGGYKSLTQPFTALNIDFNNVQV